MVGFCDFTGFDYGPVSKNMAVKSYWLNDTVYVAQLLQIFGVIL